jgi:flagellar assembly protein FliH
MNSSTKPPLASTQKFHFEIDFEMEGERLRLEEEMRQEAARQKALAAAEVERVMTYTEDQVAAFRIESEQAGYARGLADAKKSTDQAVQSIAEKMIADLALLIQNEDMRQKSAQRVAAGTALAAIKKAWPQLIEKYGFDRIEGAVRHALELNAQEGRIVVRVHDTMLDAVVTRLPQLKEHEAFAGKIIVLADDAVVKGDCKVEWADGGLEVLGRTLATHLDDALARVISGSMA